MTAITREANFLLPDDVLNELRTSVPKRQQSKVVAEELRKELKRIKLAKALEASFGGWKEKVHPELKKGPETFVGSLRTSRRMRFGKASFKCMLMVAGIAAVLSSQFGCSNMKSPGPISEQQTEILNEKLGTIGVVSAKYAPRVELQLPAKGTGAGAAKGAVRLPLSFIETAAGSGNPYMAVLSIIVSPVMAVAGAVSGAVMAAPAITIEQQEAALKKPLNDMNIQETMRARFLTKTPEMNRYVFSELAEEGPRADGEHPDYRGLRARGINTVNEIAMREFGLEGDGQLEQKFRLYMQAQARLVSTEDNNTILVRTFTCESKTYDFPFWTSGNAQRFREEIDRCYDDLIDMMAATIYLKDTVLRGTKGREAPSTGRPR